MKIPKLQTQEFKNAIASPRKCLPPNNPIVFTNKTISHQYKPISQFFNNIDISQNYSSIEFIDNTSTARVIYNVNTDKYSAYGWLQNISSNWHNKWAMDASNHNYFGCIASSATDFIIEGLNVGTEYELTYYPTRMGSYSVPASFIGTAQSCSSSTGCLQIPINFTLGCDTTSSDFAFILQTTTPLARIGQHPDDQSNIGSINGIKIFPTLSLGFIQVESNVNEKHSVELYGADGHLVFELEFDEQSHLLNFSSIIPSVYYLRIYNSKQVFIQKIILQ